MDALALLKAGHKKIVHLFEKLEFSPTYKGVERPRLFERLNQELTTHMHIEEEALYPVIRDHEQTCMLGVEAMEEHHALKILLGELASIPLDSVEWSAKFVVLKEGLKLHIEEMEGYLFPQARKALSPDEWEGLAAMLERENLRQQSSMLVSPL